MANVTTNSGTKYSINVKTKNVYDSEGKKVGTILMSDDNQYYIEFNSSKPNEWINMNVTADLTSRRRIHNNTNSRYYLNMNTKKIFHHFDSSTPVGKLQLDDQGIPYIDFVDAGKENMWLSDTNSKLFKSNTAKKTNKPRHTLADFTTLSSISERENENNNNNNNNNNNSNPASLATSPTSSPTASKSTPLAPSPAAPNSAAPNSAAPNSAALAPSPTPSPAAPNPAALAPSPTPSPTPSPAASLAASTHVLQRQASSGTLQKYGTNVPQANKNDWPTWKSKNPNGTLDDFRMRTKSGGKRQSRKRNNRSKSYKGKSYKNRK